MLNTIDPPIPPVFSLLPGPDRKRQPAAYRYSLTFRNPETGPGCVMVWDVNGGRMSYQIALERDEVGTLHLHCTCADAIFRAEPEGRFCKHVRGLLDIGKTAPPVSNLDQCA